MQRSYPGISRSISGWKGQDITDFQEELLKTVNAHLSEKWFYTHMKSDNPSLPRIDVLNLLCRYAGYMNWDDFIFKNSDPVSLSLPPGKANRYFIIIPLAVLVILVMFYGIFKLFNTREYRFSFYDADTKDPITNSRIEVTLLLEGESPVNYLCNPQGCFMMKTDKSRVRFVAGNPYYKTDTVVRVLRKFNREEMVFLHANEYALMIHYFSQMNVRDWEKRRLQMDKMIDDSALIYQVYGTPRAPGMELYNKQEFINKMTLPSGSLKGIEILDTKYSGDKIMILRFRVKEKN